MRRCSLCGKETENNDSQILTLGAYGNPKYLCDECAEDIEEMCSGREYEGIKSAFKRVYDKFAANPILDETVNNTLHSMMSDAQIRANKIKDGTYDFSLDEQEQDGFEEIPEELLETEEDLELDRKERIKNEKIDKVLNVLFVLIIVAVIGFVAYRLIV